MKELKEKSVQDLMKSIVEKRESLRKIRFGSMTNSAKNVKEVHALRKDIARSFTELSLRDGIAKKAKAKETKTK
ncbi:MAG: 50S ribosomal protein L29 [Patescibacteria group bacterium]